VWTVPARVTRVIDGDTLVCDLDLGWNVWHMEQRVRLLGIDTPELKGSTRMAGEAARLFVINTLGWSAAWNTEPVAVTVVSEQLDSFGRVLGRVLLADGSDLSTLLLDAGHAVPMRG